MFWWCVDEKDSLCCLCLCSFCAVKGFILKVMMGMYPQHKYNYKMLLKQHKMIVTLEQMLVVCYIDCYSQTILINAI